MRPKKYLYIGKDKPVRISIVLLIVILAALLLLPWIARCEMGALASIAQHPDHVLRWITEASSHPKGCAAVTRWLARQRKDIEGYEIADALEQRPYHASVKRLAVKAPDALRRIAEDPVWALEIRSLASDWPSFMEAVWAVRLASGSPKGAFERGDTPSSAYSTGYSIRPLAYSNRGWYKGGGYGRAYGKSYGGSRGAVRGYRR